jgi:hypothetical protein
MKLFKISVEGDNKVYFHKAEELQYIDYGSDGIRKIKFNNLDYIYHIDYDNNFRYEIDGFLEGTKELLILGCYEIYKEDEQ